MALLEKFCSSRPLRSGSIRGLKRAADLTCDNGVVNGVQLFVSLPNSQTRRNRHLWKIPPRDRCLAYMNSLEGKFLTASLKYDPIGTNSRSI
jgi:hypothetical protein